MNTGIANSENPRPKKKVRIEFFADYMFGGFFKGDLENIRWDCSEGVRFSGFDVRSLKFHVVVDGNRLDVDYSKIKTSCEGEINYWSDYADCCGVYHISVEKMTNNCAEIIFEIDDDFALDNLMFIYKTAINPDGKDLMILTGISYDGIDILSERDRPFGGYYGKTTRRWAFKENRFASIENPTAIENLSVIDLMEYMN